ncbi:hypothetical protein EI020_24505, partial [Escherichia coli]|nr:hypothetical protein [Escherichia coli]
MKRKRAIFHRERITVQQQMVKLLESGVLLRFDRTLDETLQHIVDAARIVIGARYAALGVLGENDKFSRFFYSGLSKEEAKKIGEPPKGRGLLGLIMEGSKAIRLKDLTKHPKAFGF